MKKSPGIPYLAILADLCADPAFGEYVVNGAWKAALLVAAAIAVKRLVKTQRR